MPHLKKCNLRTGFTTGACSAAVVMSAWMSLIGGESGGRTKLLFPDGEWRVIGDVLIDNLETESTVSASIVKDAGDDPDVTNGVTLRAEVSSINDEGAVSRDHILAHGDSILFLRGSSGVGMVTRNGLDTPPGKWAINSIPREMILKNLVQKGFGAISGRWLAKISVPNGERIAKKTLNPSLGVIGGISILGTSGIVVPYSNEAYIETIRILVNGICRSGCSDVVFVTGARTFEASRRDIPSLPEYAFVRIGDFIGDSLRIAGKAGIKKATVSCMYGKLVKYALGLYNTHAAKTELSPGDMTPFANILPEGLREKALSSLIGTAGARDALESMDDATRKILLEKIGDSALAMLYSHVQGFFDLKIELMLYTPAGELVSSWRR